MKFQVHSAGVYEPTEKTRVRAIIVDGEAFVSVTDLHRLGTGLTNESFLAQFPLGGICFLTYPESRSKTDKPADYFISLTDVLSYCVSDRADLTYGRAFNSESFAYGWLASDPWRFADRIKGYVRPEVTKESVAEEKKRKEELTTKAALHRHKIELLGYEIKNITSNIENTKVAMKKALDSTNELVEFTRS